MYSQTELALIAIQNHLFVKDWNISRHYDDIVDNNRQSHYLISVFFEQDTPVACATLHKSEKFLNVYVNPEYRGKNFGIKIIEQLLNEHNIDKKEVYAFIGEDGTEQFYKKAGIACFADDIPMTDQETQDYLNHKLNFNELVKIKIKQKLEEYQNNIATVYEKKHPRTVPKLK